MIRHGYFVLQAKAETTGAEVVLSGIIENLATGNKSTFSNVHQLGGILTQWSRENVADVVVATPGGAPS